MAIKKVIEIDVQKNKAEANLNSVDESLKKVDKSQAEVNKTTGDFGGIADKATGGALSGLKGLIAPIKAAIVGFKGLSLAIAATGLGLLLVAIGAIGAAFKSSEEGQNQFAKLMGVIGSVTGKLTDILSSLGEKLIWAFTNPRQAINDFIELVKTNVINRFEGLLKLIPRLGTALDQLFSGDLKGAAKTAGDAFGQVALGVENVTDKIKGGIEATKEFAKEQKRLAEDAAKVADKRAAADKLERDLIQEKAKAERDIAELRLKARQTDQFSAEERKQALNEAAALEDKVIGKEKEVLQLRFDAIKIENTLSKSNKEALTAQEQAAAALINIETKKADAQKANLRETKRVDSEISKMGAERAKAENERIQASIKANEERLKTIEALENEYRKKNEDAEVQNEQEKIQLEKRRAIERLDTLIGDEEEKRQALEEINRFYDEKLEAEASARKAEKDALEAEIAQIERMARLELELLQMEEEGEIKLEKEIEIEQAKAEALLANEDLTESQRALIIQKSADKITGIRSKAAEAEKEIERLKNEALVQMIQGTMGAISNILGNQSKAGKAFAIAAALMNTYQGISNVWAEKAESGLVGAGFAQRALTTALVAAQGFAAVKNIAKVKTPGGGGGGFSVPSASSIPAASTSEPAAPQFDVNAGSVANQLAGLGDSQAPIQTYVVANNVTSAQALDRNIIENASIG
jgi:hypothetical protein